MWDTTMMVIVKILSLQLGLAALAWQIPGDSAADLGHSTVWGRGASAGYNSIESTCQSSH